MILGRRRKGPGWALVLGLLGTACTGGHPGNPVTPSGPVATGTGSSHRFVEPPVPKSLCDHPKLNPEPAPSAGGPLPPIIATVAQQVQAERGLRFEHPVAPEAVSHQRLVRLLQAGLNQEYPPALEGRKGRAWATIGAIPAGTDLRQAILDFAGTQIIGFYDTLTTRLVFEGTTSPSPFERFTLSHELTHALQDQAFGLSRLDRLHNTCRDEQFLAFLSLVEGDAVESQLRWARSYLSADEVQELDREASSVSPPPSSVPPFVRELLDFPYIQGRQFVEALESRGGLNEVNAALRDPPDSTEQILHPSVYPNDQPDVVTVPEIKEKLGGPWQDLDLQDVGEAWLRFLLQLQLPQDEAARAAAGWGGGQYRAWTLGDRTAVLMETVWDTKADGSEFASAMGRFLAGRTGAVTRRGQEVDVLIGSDRVALEDLRRVAG